MAGARLWSTCPPAPALHSARRLAQPDRMAHPRTLPLFFTRTLLCPPPHRTQDLLAAHEDVGLLLREGREGDYAFAFPALAPWKDCEVSGWLAMAGGGWWWLG